MRQGSTLAAAVLTGLIFTAALTAPLSALAEPAAPVTAALEHPIRIGLGWGLTSAQVGATAGLLLIDQAEQTLLELPPGEAVTAKRVGGQLLIEGLPDPITGPVRLVPAPASHITYKGKQYRGEVELLVTAQGSLSVVNLLELEEYLPGVVPNEMPSGWPVEALKAQAVAARTFAMMNIGRRGADGFDLRDTPDDQSYGGLLAERGSTTDAVRQTKGQVITLKGKMVAAYYHSSSGGYTEDNENIWVGGKPEPYLRAVPDFDNLPDNPWYSWRYEYTATELNQKLKQAGYKVGEVQSITPGPLATSGRPIRWSIVGASGQATLNMAQIRSALGLPAAPRAISLTGVAVTPTPPPTPPAIVPPPEPKPKPKPVAAPVYVIGVDGQVQSRQVAGSAVIGADGARAELGTAPVIARGAASAAFVGKLTEVAQEPEPEPTPEPTPQPEPTPTPTPTPKPTGVVVEGGGFGHGIGLSQWGARGMAILGKRYDEILAHFYTGTKVETRYLEDR